MSDLVGALDQLELGALGDVTAVELVRGASYPPFEGGALPAWYRDAGYPFRDLGPECLYVLQRLLGPVQDVAASWRSRGGAPDLAFDEWRATVTCERGTGELQLDFDLAPARSYVVVHGSRGTQRLEPFALLAGVRAKAPKIAERLLAAVAGALQPLVAGRPHAAEVPAADAARLAPFVDKVALAAEADHEKRRAAFRLGDKAPFLVTGAAGGLGRAVVARLKADHPGKKLRVFVRRMPDTPDPQLEYAFGNLADAAAVDRAVAGVEVVIHVGAATKGGWPAHHAGTVVGTQNVIDACLRHGAKQLVHISSMSVIDWAGSVGRGTIDESAALEPHAEQRGAYTRGKLEAEGRVAAAAAQGLPCVILRPGQIFGGGIPLVNGAVARRAAGRWLVLGDGTLELPLVYIDDVVDAIVLAVQKKLVGGEVIQLIDRAALTQSDVLDRAGGGAPRIQVPRAVVFALGRLSELPLGALGKPSPIGVYRLRSALARLHYGSARAEQLLGWTPRVGVHEGIRRVAEP